MEKVRGDFQTLYQREETPPPGLPLVTHVDLAEVSYNISLEAEAEVEALVQRLRPHRAGGHTHLCAKYFEQWLREAYPGKQPKTPRGGSSGSAW